jgi:NAD(P)-dependent dehydrogenase (short-subunit alcohol dehydrogenase family)
MAMDLAANRDDSVLLVTGSSRGIGRAVCEAAGSFGTTVIHGRSLDRLHGLVDSLRARGRDAFAVAADLADPEQARGLVDEVCAKTGRIDVLVNNAATTGGDGFVAADQVTPSAWADNLAVNLTAHFLTSQAAFGVMSAAGGGQIINISSYAGVAGFVGLAPYSAAKAGLIALSRTLAAEWASSNVRVNCVVLGPVVPDEVGEKPGSDGSPAAGHRASRSFSWQADVVGTIARLAEDRHSVLTGALITLDGCAGVQDFDSMLSLLRKSLHSPAEA